MEPLILAARSKSIEVQRETAAAMCNMSLAEENKIIMARGGALAALISLAMSGDKEREVSYVYYTLFYIPKVFLNLFFFCVLDSFDCSTGEHR